MRDTEGDGFRPARWAWTTITATILLALVLFVVVTLASDLAVYDTSVLEALELGLAIGLVPTVVVAALAWRVRRKGEEVDERASATLGVLAVIVLGLGFAAALLEWPVDLRSRLVSETAMSMVGAGLMISSVWIRHVPRPWWPREHVSD